MILSDPASSKTTRTDSVREVFPGPFDPRVILEAIARDERQPAVARVAACRAYVAMSAPQSPQDKAMSALNERTMEILARGSVH
jgi:hypothetical protein